jgi:hypothetical protein
VQEAEGGPNELNNAIVLCQRCHLEVGHYNDQHPLGNKYSPNELLKHRDLFWCFCDRSPGFSIHEDPIGISPCQISMPMSNGLSLREFTLSNRTPDPCWQVWIKISSGKSDEILKKLEIDILEPILTDHRIKRLGDFTMEIIDVMTEDELGNKSRFIMVPRMPPHSSTSYSLRLGAVPDSLELFVNIFDIGSEPLHIKCEAEKPSFTIPFCIPINGESQVHFRGHYPI